MKRLRKKLAKVIGTSRVAVSKDGKVTTVTSKGTDEGGQPTNNVAVYDGRKDVR